jgi:phosphoenolpyruvate synthase/pyruvate phosphate dikinase
MGVVVQPYRRFSLAGLLFTQHVTVPVRDWMLLEYLDVDPARLVAGEEVPHRCRVHPGTKRTVWENRVAGRPELSVSLLDQLVEGATQLKELLHCEVDIEWGVRGETAYFLQCRPATTTPMSDG